MLSPNQLLGFCTAFMRHLPILDPTVSAGPPHGIVALPVPGGLLSAVLKTCLVFLG